MTRLTSIRAYREILESGGIGKAQRHVLEALADNGPMTGSELDEYLSDTLEKWTRRSSRTSELRQMGLVEERGTRVCRVTGKEVIVWSLCDEPDYRPLLKPKKPTRRQLENALQEAARRSALYKADLAWERLLRRPKTDQLDD